MASGSVWEVKLELGNWWFIEKLRETTLRRKEGFIN